MPATPHSPHLTEIQLLRCVAGRSDRSEVDEIVAHAAGCFECREKLLTMGGALKKLCTEFDVAAASGGAPVRRHETEPATASESTGAPRVTPVSVEPRPWKPRFVLGWALAIAAMLILLFAYFFHTGRSGPVYVSEVRDPAGQFRLLDTGRLDAPLSLPDELRTRVASVLAKKGISELESLSPQLEAMRAKSATLAAPQIDPDKLMALRPMNSSVATNRPLFQWTRPGGATSFLFTVKNDSGFSWQTNVMNATNLVLPQASASLPEGQMFTWQVETRIGRSLSVSAPAWFYVLNATSAAELHRRELDLAGSPLALGTLYAAYGLLDEAEAQFHRVLSLNTNHPVAMTVLDQLARRRGRGP